MPQVIAEDRLCFTFPDNTVASKYDEWTFYRKRYKSG